MAVYFYAFNLLILFDIVLISWFVQNWFWFIDPSASSKVSSVNSEVGIFLPMGVSDECAKKIVERFHRTSDVFLNVFSWRLLVVLRFLLISVADSVDFCLTTSRENARISCWRSLLFFFFFGIRLLRLIAPFNFPPSSHLNVLLGSHLFYEKCSLLQCTSLVSDRKIILRFIFAISVFMLLCGVEQFTISFIVQSPSRSRLSPINHRTLLCDARVR